MQHDVGRLELADVDAVAVFLDEQLVERGEEAAADVALEVDAADDVDPDPAGQRPVERTGQAGRQVEIGIDDLDPVLGGVDQLDEVAFERVAADEAARMWAPLADDAEKVVSSFVLDPP